MGGGGGGVRQRFGEHWRIIKNMKNNREEKKSHSAVNKEGRTCFI